MRLRLPCLLMLCLALAPVLRAAERFDLSIDPVCGLPRLFMEGDPMENYSIESVDEVAGLESWKPVMDFMFEDGSMKSWCDASHSAQRKFYRMLRLSAPPPEVRLRNFRLIDHAGKSQELYYSFNDSKVRLQVLVFAGGTCSNLAPVLPALNRIASDFSPDGVRVWGLCSPLGNVRPRIAAEAAALGISFPVLHDRAGIVSKEYGIDQAPEAVLIRNGTFRALYRGPVEESDGAGGTLAYLQNAIERTLAGEQPNPSRVRASGPSADLAAPAHPAYASQIAPILQAKCVTCHSPGNIAPWAMTNHQAVAAYADSIKDEVLSARMPPWHADPQVGHFSNDSSLTPGELSALMEWIDSGAPRGEGSDPLENVPAPPPDWPLGQPDMVLTIPEENLPAAGDIGYKYIPLKPQLGGNKWVRAAVVRPGNRRVVHHSLVFLGSQAESLGGLSGYFAGYVPGLDPSLYPAGTGKLLTNGVQFTVQMHYISVGTPQKDQTQIGLYFLTNPPPQRLQTKAAFDVFFRIPPGAADHTTTARSSAFAKAALLHEISPHQHYRGKWFNYELELRDGTRRPLINVPRYVFDWQRLYRFAEPVQIPVGARIVCTGAWDNSPQNLYNPDAKASVGFGEQTYQEMFIGYYNYSEAQ